MPSTARVLVAVNPRVSTRNTPGIFAASSAILVALVPTRAVSTAGPFGRTIGAFQALQHRAAQLFCEVEIAKSAVLAALQALDADPEQASLAVSVAKAKAASVARLAAQEAIQMHGGIGMTDAIDIGLFAKRMQVASELYGDADFHADRVALARGF